MPVSPDVRILVDLVVFLSVMGLAIARPRGLNEAWPAVGGAAALFALGQLNPDDLIGGVRETGGVLLFLIGMMVISAVLEQAGIFTWAASYAARASGGSGRRLLLNVFALGGVVTALLSLDVTVIILTPIVYETVVALDIDPLPYLYACTFVANTGSLLFPMSNLTNLLVVDRLGLPFWRFTIAMALPDSVAIAANAALFLWLFRDRLPRRIHMEAPAPSASGARKTRFFLMSSGIFGLILAAIFAAGLAERPLWPVALAGGAALTIIACVFGAQSLRAIAAGISWSLFPFVWGMAAVVRAMEHAGLTARLGALVLGHAGAGPGAIAVTGAVAAIGANLFNNIPMALLMLTVLAGAPRSRAGLLALAMLAGVNIGPALTTVGSLATMLWLSFTRRQGVEVPALEYLRVSVVTVPLVLAAALGAVALGAILR
jgi:arsenical pump membrane protein